MMREIFQEAALDSPHIDLIVKKSSGFFFETIRKLRELMRLSFYEKSEFFSCW